MYRMFSPHAASIGALALTLTFAHAAVFAQSVSNTASKPGIGNNGNTASVVAAKPVDDGLPKKTPKPVRNSDGTPAGDAALGIAPEPDVDLPDAARIQKKAHKHEVKHGKVDRDVYPTGPLPMITKLR
jgi:hypothetical protein